MANNALGHNSGETQKIGYLSSGARGLLVAMVCYGISDAHTEKGLGGLHLNMGPLPMNMSQMRASFTTMIGNPNPNPQP
jgi:hypothetical protein